MSAAGHLEPVPEPAADGLLFERSAELATLAAAVAGLADRRGAVVMLEAPAGLGKTALLDHVSRLAEDAGCSLRRAAPGPLERHFPFGAVRALLEGPVRMLGAAERRRLGAGAGEDALRLLLGGAAPGGDAGPLIAHSVFWLCAALAAARPLVLVVDDAQWADRPSLEALSYLAGRIEELPVLVVVAARADDPAAPTDLLSLLAGARTATTLRPQALTAWGAVALIRRYAPDASLRACLDYHRAANGSPWLLDELGRQLAHSGPAAVTADARDIVRRRLAALPPRDRSVAAALAILGNCAPLHVVAALAEVSLGELTHARDALKAAGLLADDGLRFAHGLIADAVAEDLAHSERERLHRAAARLLAEADACSGAVAPHLLECSPQGDPEVSTELIRAAAGAAAQGSPLVAAGYLERALDERAPGDDRARMLADLGAVAYDAGLPGAQAHLRDALRELRDDGLRTDVLTRLAALEVIADAGGDIADLLADHDGLSVDVAMLDALVPRPERQAERLQRLEALDGTAIDDAALARSVTAHRAWAATELGTLPAAQCAELALDALTDGVLLADASRRAGYHLAVRTLVLTDRHAEAGTAIAALRDHAETRGSVPLRALAAWYAADLALRTGDVARAEHEGRVAVDLAGDGLNPALDVLVSALAERGELDDAEAVLQLHGIEAPDHARARLWLEKGDYERAYEEACDAGALRAEQGRPNPTWTPWRATAALALAHLGRCDEAAALADDDIALAERFGAPVPLAAALHARAVAERDDAARIAICLRALRTLDGVDAVLEKVRVRLELGRALLRSGARVRAREALRPALADADAVGAVPLAKRARRELVATGMRPRRAAIEGAAALTPRQRQICSLAAAGRANRDIARALFLSIKTVETHLAAGYRKLGITSRAELAAALAG